MFGKKSRTEDHSFIAGNCLNLSGMNMQASLLSAASHAAEVSELKRRLEKAEEELGQVKRQLQENQGM